MSDTSTPIGPPLPAATVVILRDGRDGLEVFMVVRHQEIDFASGALVFPGGKVDPGDADAAWADLAPYAAATPDRTFVVAAVRETFEEAGLVLARRRGTRAMLDAGDTHRLVETYRAPLLAGETTFLDLVRAEDLLLATDLMVPFAHWITPERVGKRFDTHFLLVAAPVDQLGAHDGGESVEGFWIAPRQALRDAEAGSPHPGAADADEPHQARRPCDRGRGRGGDAGKPHRHRHAEDRAHGQRPQAAHSRRSRLRRHRGAGAGAEAIASRSQVADRLARL